MILIVLRIYILKIGNFLTYECCYPRKETGVISPTLLPHNGHDHRVWKRNATATYTLDNRQLINDWRQEPRWWAPADV